VWIVKIALQRPYTFIVLAIVIQLMGLVAISRLAVDVFPRIDLPIAATIWGYSGPQSENMAQRSTSFSRRPVHTAVSDVEPPRRSR
jgi:multidrug efflux pump subunit AcrB